MLFPKGIGLKVFLAEALPSKSRVFHPALGSRSPARVRCDRDIVLLNICDLEFVFPPVVGTALDRALHFNCGLMSKMHRNLMAALVQIRLIHEKS